MHLHFELAVVAAQWILGGWWLTLSACCKNMDSILLGLKFEKYTWISHFLPPKKQNHPEFNYRMFSLLWDRFSSHRKCRHLYVKILSITSLFRSTVSQTPSSVLFELYLLFCMNTAGLCFTSAHIYISWRTLWRLFLFLTSFSTLRYHLIYISGLSSTLQNSVCKSCSSLHDPASSSHSLPVTVWEISWNPGSCHPGMCKTWIWFSMSATGIANRPAHNTRWHARLYTGKWITKETKAT